MNLQERQRQQYQVFTTFEAFGIGRETDNKFDNLLIYGIYGESDHYKKFVSDDIYYGARAYEPYLRDYLEGERENIDEFMRALGPTATAAVFLTTARQSVRSVAPNSLSSIGPLPRIRLWPNQRG